MGDLDQSWQGTGRQSHAQTWLGKVRRSGSNIEYFSFGQIFSVELSRARQVVTRKYQPVEKYWNISSGNISKISGLLGLNHKMTITCGARPVCPLSEWSVFRETPHQLTCKHSPGRKIIRDKMSFIIPDFTPALSQWGLSTTTTTTTEPAI